MANPIEDLLSKLKGGGASSRRTLLIGALALVVILIGVGGYLYVKGNASSSPSTLSTPSLPTVTSSTTTSTTLPGVTTTILNYGNKDPFVPLVASTATTAASSPTTSATGSTTTLAGGSTSTTLVSLTTTTTGSPSQIALISVSPVGQPAVAQVSVNGTVYSGITPGQTVGVSYVLTSIDQTTGCATFSNGGANPFELCLNQAIVK